MTDPEKRDVARIKRLEAEEVKQRCRAIGAERELAALQRQHEYLIEEMKGNGPLAARCLRSEAALERVEAERDLALRALGYDSYEAAQRYLMSALSGPAPAGWPYAASTLSADSVSEDEQ